MVLYDEVGNELLKLSFDGQGSNKYTWMSRDRLINDNTPYSDLIGGDVDFFSVAGSDDGENRRFFINQIGGGCVMDAGWLVMIPRDNLEYEATPCAWEKAPGYTPAFLYSKLPTAVTWDNTAGGEY